MRNHGGVDYDESLIEDLSGCVFGADGEEDVSDIEILGDFDCQIVELTVHK